MEFNSIQAALPVCAGVRKLHGTTRWKSDCCNVVFLQSGSLAVTIGGTRYANGQLLSWYSKQEVLFEASTDCDAAFLLLRPEILIDMQDTIPLLSHVTCVPPSEEALSAGEHLLRLCRDPDPQAPRRSLEETGHLLDLLQVLLDHCETEDPLPAPIIALSDRRISMYRAIYTYMTVNYNRGITQAKTAEDFSITPQYLGRVLKEACGKTFRQLLLEIRETQRDLYARYTSLSGDEIARRLDGEASVLSFPREDVSSLHSLPGMPGQLRSSRVVKTSPTDTSMNPNGLYLNAVIDPRQHLPGFWNSLINLGYASDLQKTEIGESLARAQKELDFRYGRICRILDLVSTYQAGGQEIYDFSPVFSLLDQLIQNGMTPFLELGNKNLMINQTASLSITPESAGPSDLYYDHLESVLPWFVRACINHYGMESFRNWYFEVSYSYTETTQAKKFGISQYVSRFRKICQIIHAYCPDCRIGGPGFNDWGNEDLVQKDLHRLVSCGFHPDFYTCYLYPLVDENGERMVLSGNAHLLRERIVLFRQILQQQAPDMEIWVTETNSNLSSRTFLNDSSYQAAWLCRNVLDLLHTGIRSFGYYLLYDTALRYRDTSDFLFGGWGLLSDSDIPKPSYHALSLLSRLSPYCIKNTDRYLIAADYPGRFQILLVRYCHPRREALRKNVTKDALSSPESVFESCGTERCHVRLKGILPGIYILQEFIVSSSCSNLLHTWKELSCLSLQYTPELESRVSASRLFVRTTTCTVEEDGIFNLDTELVNNEVRLITCSLSREQTAEMPARAEEP